MVWCGCEYGGSYCASVTAMNGTVSTRNKGIFTTRPSSRPASGARGQVLCSARERACDMPCHVMYCGTKVLSVLANGMEGPLPLLGRASDRGGHMMGGRQCRQSSPSNEKSRKTRELFESPHRQKHFDQVHYQCVLLPVVTSATTTTRPDKDRTGPWPSCGP